jgi:multidrug resistance protein MdtO
MATLAQSVLNSQQPSRWFWAFLKEELRPYPGRGALVARMMIAATIVMIITMTFRIPEGAYAALYALTVSRESPRATVAALKMVAIVFVIAAAYELVGAMFFVSEPLLRLIWLIVTFFLMFYSLRVLTSYTAGVRFGYLVVITTPLWDGHISAEAKVEGTLWAVFALTLATGVATLVELVYAELTRGNDLIRPLAERLSSVEEVVLAYAEARPIHEQNKKNITRLAMVGMSQLRRNLHRSSYAQHYREQMGAVLALVSRLVDIAANTLDVDIKLSDAERARMGDLAERIASIRRNLEAGVAPRPTELQSPSGAPSAFPLLREMEATVSLIPEAFLGSQTLSAYTAPASVDAPQISVFRADALSNSENLKFALKGCLAASLCYIIYSMLDWPGLNTAITTCFLTALTTIGASRQKQMLRIAGVIAGGLVLGIGAQVFILPHLDSIADFTVLFLGATFIAAWFATCSARLSYFGVQIAIAFYLINLQEFKIQTSLAVARDRVVGILLGLSVMWLVFDHLWGTPTAVEMKKTFVLNLRLLAQFIREPVSTDARTAIDRSLALREKINTQFDQVRALADGVVLEFGPSRRCDLDMRERIRQWQPQLRTLFLMRIVSLKYKLRLPGFDLPEAVRVYQCEYDEHSAQMLEEMADAIEDKPSKVKLTPEVSLAFLERVLQACSAPESQLLPAVRVDSFVTLLRKIDQLTAKLAQEVAMEVRSGRTVSSRGISIQNRGATWRTAD